jgi:hypothetical protein
MSILCILYFYDAATSRVENLEQVFHGPTGWLQARLFFFSFKNVSNAQTFSRNKFRLNDCFQSVFHFSRNRKNTKE